MLLHLALFDETEIHKEKRDRFSYRRWEFSHRQCRFNLGVRVLGALLISAPSISVAAAFLHAVEGLKLLWIQ